MIPIKKCLATIHNPRFGWFLVFVLGGVGLLLGTKTLLTMRQAFILIEWSTASEIDTAGYNILRKEAWGETYTQLNDRLIPAADDPLLGGDYSFEDHGVEAGKTYTYILEEIETTGTKNQRGAIMQEAENNAWIDFVLSGLSLLSAGIAAWIQVRNPCKKNAAGSSTDETIRRAPEARSGDG